MTRGKAKPKAKKSQARGPNVWRRAFLAVYRRTGNVTLAAEAAKTKRSTIHHARRIDPKFSAQCDEALEESSEYLEAEAYRRAVTGVLEPVFGSGGTGVGTVECGAIRKFSDTLLIFLMKGANPLKYREHYQVSHEGQSVLVVEDANWYRASDNPAPPAPAPTADTP